MCVLNRSPFVFCRLQLFIFFSSSLSLSLSLSLFFNLVFVFMYVLRFSIFIFVVGFCICVFVGFEFLYMHVYGWIDMYIHTYNMWDYGLWPKMKWIEWLGGCRLYGLADTQKQLGQAHIFLYRSMKLCRNGKNAHTYTAYTHDNQWSKP